MLSKIDGGRLTARLIGDLVGKFQVFQGLKIKKPIQLGNGLVSFAFCLAFNRQGEPAAIFR